MFRHIIHLHIPAFPIAAARASVPALRDRPVVVAPFHSDRAVVLSVSAEARRERIWKGMPLRTAMKRCSGLTVLPPDPERLEHACRALTRRAARYTPVWEPAGPGHLYLDVTGTERLWGRAKDVAVRLREDVGTALRLPGTVGVAGNKMVSSIASRLMRSEEVRDVNHGGEASFMAPLGVDMLPGIGSVRRKVLLEELNITRIRDLAALDMGALNVVFGSRAYVIHQRARGIDPSPVNPPRNTPMVTEEVTLARDENDDRVLLGALYGLIERCGNRLRRRTLLPRKAGLMLRYSDRMEVTVRLRLPRLSFWDYDLYGPVEALFFKACTRRVRVGFLRVMFWDFSPSRGQMSLFQDTSSGTEAGVRIIETLDRIRQRHGRDAIRWGRSL